LKVLIVEDDAVSRRVLQVTLTKWGYHVVTASNGLEAWQILRQSDAPRLAIVDWVMPGMDGLELCREIRKMDDVPYIYTLLLTGKGSTEDVVEGMHAGADDYIRKPFDPGELKVRLRAGKRILDLQAELLAARESLRYQATHDSLTGLLNRGAILEFLRNEVEKTSRRNIDLSLIVADVDHFKQINDTYGHIVGDAVLCEAGRRMKNAVRSDDSVGRYGGEEFLIVLPGCSADQAMGLSERLKSDISGQAVELPGMSITFTISFGLASAKCRQGEDAGRLVQAADRALYQAKNRGRNCIVLAEEAEDCITR
jgi:two-component system cell cycle response regulator